MLLHEAVACSFMLLYIIPFHEYNRIYIVGEHLGCF